jgi:hypothetical protein|tara:strand:+ start:18728 stop:19768 length:1041 start_codon:yes stop_codon:yes gene_type:complete
MALTEKQISELRDHLDNCKNPLFFFDDDQDGLCSFLQLYRYKREGHGIVVKTAPKLGTIFLAIVNDYAPDKIFILDIADVEQEFLDQVKVPVVWIDHHGPFERENVKYFNPRVQNKEDNFPTSFLCHQIVKGDLWLATLGCVADWFIPDFIKDFEKEYPELIGKPYKTPPDIIYNTRLGNLIRVFSFILKGKNSEVFKSFKILTRIKDPYEILNQTTSQGKFIYQRYEKINKLYTPLLADLMGALEKSKDKLVLFTYQDDKSSFTSDLSNEAIYRYPDKVIMIAREKNGQMKGSLRSTKIKLPELISKSLNGLEGYGGGHEHACGFNVKKEDFEEFVKRIRDLISV